MHPILTGETGVRTAAPIRLLLENTWPPGFCGDCATEDQQSGVVKPFWTARISWSTQQRSGSISSTSSTSIRSGPLAIRKALVARATPHKVRRFDTAVVLIELPARFGDARPNCFDPARSPLDQYSSIDGSTDFPIISANQTPQTSGEQSVQAFYDATPSSIRKLKGTLIGPQTTMMCRASRIARMPRFPCVNGVMDTWVIRRRGLCISCKAMRSLMEHL